MLDYEIDEKYRYFSLTTTKGTQIKYFKDNYYYKINQDGNEGLVEYITTLILENSSLPKNSYVPYEYCKINGRLGCRSYNFLKENEEFITMNSLYYRLTGYNNLTDKIFSMNNISERLLFLLEIANAYGIDVKQFRNYLEIIMQVDYLIRNVDRHAHNYGIIYNSNTSEYRIAPIFDNGRALGTALGVSEASCTISGSFEMQLTAFSFPVLGKFVIDFDNLLQDLKCLEDEIGKKREIDKLRMNLKEYGNIFIEKNMDIF